MTQKCAVKAGLIRPDWAGKEEIRIYAMHWVLELKFQQCPYTFGKALMQTGDRPIVEMSRKDAFWGCFLKGEQLIGSNVLGNLLMIIRADADRLKGGELTYPDGFLLR